MKVKDVKLYEVSDEALDYYRKNIKGNKYISHGEAALKLARNIKLATKRRIGLFRNVFEYGSLHIYTVFGKIVEIKNNRGQPFESWKFDKKEYIRISKLLGIKNCKFDR